MAKLSAANQRPTPVKTLGTGTRLLALDGLSGSYIVSYQNLSSTPSGYHFYGLVAAEVDAGVLFSLTPSGSLGTSGVLFGKATVGQANADGIGSGRFRFNIHTAACGGGEIRGQVLP